MAHRFNAKGCPPPSDAGSPFCDVQPCPTSVVCRIGTLVGQDKNFAWQVDGPRGDSWDPLMHKILSAILSIPLVCVGAPPLDGPPPLPSGADPALLSHGIYATSAPLAEQTAATPTTLPLTFKKGDRIALVGNTLLDRAQAEGNLETALQQTFPTLGLIVRNLAWSADEVDLQPRPDNFATQLQHRRRGVGFQ